MTQLERPIKDLLREPRVPVEALWQRIERERARPLPAARVPGFAAVLAGVFALASLLAIFALPHLPQLRMEQRVLRHGPSAASDAGPLRRADGAPLGVLSTGATGTGDHGAALDVALSDGSHLQLEPGAKLVTRSSEAQLFRAELLGGSILFDVVAHAPRRWIIEAADTRVEVLGTRFRVEHQPAASRAPAEARLLVAVERGRVSVRGPRVPGGQQTLSRGEQLLLTPQLPAASLPAVPAPAPDEPPAPSPPPHTSASMHDLLRAADVARSSGDYGRAQRLLRRALRDHPDDAQASLVALTLGRLQLDRLAAPSSAAASFAQANAMGLPAAVAEEGAARLVEAYARAGEATLAREAAARYRERFPNGPRSASVAAWLAPE